MYESPLTHEIYNEIPSSYLLTSKDQAFIYDYQVKTVEMIGFPKEKTKFMETGHIPFLTKPAEVRDFIIYIANGRK